MGGTLREQRAKDPSNRAPWETKPCATTSVRARLSHLLHQPRRGRGVCRKLTEAERRAGRLESGWEYRLPTEAQWEYACRAGTDDGRGVRRRLSRTQANFDGSEPFNGAPAGPYLHETTPVGSYPPNAWGLHDMHGNVWEWCRDGFTARPGGGMDPLEAPTSPRRAYRGGCWHNSGSMCLSTERGWGEVSDRGSGLGFRVALVPSGF